MTENPKPTFETNPGVYLVQGSKRSAIYDTNRCQVHSINRSATDIIIDDRRDSQFFMKLQELGLIGGVVREFTPRKPDHPSNLEFMWLSLTSRCNLTCIHCYEKSAPNRDKSSLKLSDWQSILKQGYQIGCRKIQFIGGEPLTYRHFFKLAEDARNLGFEFIELFTNATLLTPEKVVRLKKLGINVAVSLYSDQSPVHDQITGVSGSFSKTLRALHLLKDNAISTRIGVIIMKDNQHTTDSTLQLINQFGLDTDDLFDIVRPFGRGKEASIAPNDSIVRQYGTMTSPSFTTSPDLFIEGHFFNPCWNGKLAVNPNGKISPCIASDQVTVGNTRQSLEDVVNGEVLNMAWSLTKDKIETCHVCEYRYACGDCRPLAQSETGNLYAKTSRCSYDPHAGQWL